MKSIVVGTAGHIDHGKTSLVKALTGIDADRLEEEKRRGITIDLGFAHMMLGELRVSFIDVPGHEKFVRNMLAGVGGIDLVLFVVAADEGVMPQTREHFEICRLLGIERGVVAVTKSDSVDAERLAQAMRQIAEYFAGSFLEEKRAPHIAVSAMNGAGLEELKAAVARVAGSAVARREDALLRLPVDRVFTMKGFGTVVTGTLVAGSVKREQGVEIQPERKRVRVRGVQVHGEVAEAARAGERTALNLSGVAKEELRRGQVLVSPGVMSATRRFEAWVEMIGDAKPLKNRSKVHLHAFAAEAVADVVLREGAELKGGGAGFAQLRIADDQAAVLLVPGDRFVVRQFSPVVTIGGGVVLDAHPMNKRLSGDALKSFLTTLRDGSAEERLLARVERRGVDGLSAREAVRETGLTEGELRGIAAGLVRGRRVVEASDAWVAVEHWERAKAELAQGLGEFHAKNPLAAGVGKEALRDKLEMREPVFSGLLEEQMRAGAIAVTNDNVHLAGHKVRMREDESAAHKQIEDAFQRAGLKVPSVKEVLMELPIDRTRAQKIVAILLRDKVLVKISEELMFHASALAELRGLLAKEKARSPRLEVARFKELTGVSRKYAIPLLEWLDRERVTRRAGDARVIL